MEGKELKIINNGLPNSDMEIIVQSVDDVIGKKVLLTLIMKDMIYKKEEIVGISEGIFQKRHVERKYYSCLFRKRIKEKKDLIDFIEPIYESNPFMEKMARGKRINPNNPILRINRDVTPCYNGKDSSGKYLFTEKFKFCGELDWIEWVKDGFGKIYNKYKKPLREAGFKIL